MLRLLSALLVLVLTDTATAWQTPAVLPADVTEIMLEERCSGCSREMALTLKRDGTATKVVPGVARTGTSDRHFSAAFLPEQFDRLAKAILDSGFFGLLDEYRDPRLADAASVKTTVITETTRKSVLAREGSAPSSLQSIQNAISDIERSLTWQSATP